ncbi:MAG: metallophosphoesterase family protein [Pseudomonadota bacterium]
MTLYAIGDVHGQLGQLDRALALIEADGGRDASVVFMGDYVDRGPDSRAVIQRLIDGLEAGRDWTCLKGNHDRMMEWFFEPEPRHDPHLLIGFHWFHERIGGADTLASYGVQIEPLTRLNDLQKQALPHIPLDHLAFLRGLKTTHVVGDLLFVHAGMRPGVALQDQTEEDLLWIRQPFHEFERPHPHLVIHGHTPVDEATHYGNRVNIDTGAGYGRRLDPVAIEGRRVFALTDQGRVELKPRDSRA